MAPPHVSSVIIEMQQIVFINLLLLCFTKKPLKSHLIPICKRYPSGRGHLESAPHCRRQAWGARGARGGSAGSRGEINYCLMRVPGTGRSRHWVSVADLLRRAFGDAQYSSY